MKNLKLKISVSLILIIAFLTIPVLAVDHSKLICNDCHNGRFGIGSEYEGDDCGTCHKYASQDSLETEHNPNTCRACHSVTDNKAFHTLHVNNTCTTCHGATGNALPTATITECGKCHGGKLHEIHGARLDELCTTCHGKTPGKSPENSIAGFQAANKLYTKVIDYNQYTLLELIKRLFGWES